MEKPAKLKMHSHDLTRYCGRCRSSQVETTSPPTTPYLDKSRFRGQLTVRPGGRGAFRNGQTHLPTALEASPRVLVAGAGGGFDVYVALPIL